MSPRRLNQHRKAAASKNPRVRNQPTFQLHPAQQQPRPLLRPVLTATIESLSQEICKMSPSVKGTTTDTRGSTPSPRHSSVPRTDCLPIESEDLAEFVRKLSKSAWFCEVAEA